MDFTELTPDAQLRIKAKEAEVDQLLHGVQICENALARVKYLEQATEFILDASGAKFERENEAEEARETRTLLLERAVCVLFDSVAEEHWRPLTSDADKFIQLLPDIANHVYSKCGRGTKVAQETQARVLEWKKRAYQELAETQTEKAKSPANVASIATKRRPASEILAECKIKHKTTHEKLAEKMGLDRSVYFEMKRGKRVSEETYLKAAKFIGCDPSELKPAE